MCLLFQSPEKTQSSITTTIHLTKHVIRDQNVTLGGEVVALIVWLEELLIKIIFILRGFEQLSLHHLLLRSRIGQRRLEGRLHNSSSCLSFHRRLGCYVRLRLLVSPLDRWLFKSISEGNVYRRPFDDVKIICDERLPGINHVTLIVVI